MPTVTWTFHNPGGILCLLGCVFVVGGVVSASLIFSGCCIAEDC